MAGPDELDTQLDAAHRRWPAGDEHLRTLESLADEATGDGHTEAGDLSEEALELLALSEVIARKAAYGRQLTIRSARRAGASWVC